MFSRHECCMIIGVAFSIALAVAAYHLRPKGAAEERAEAYKTCIEIADTRDANKDDCRELLKNDGHKGEP